MLMVVCLFSALPAGLYAAQDKLIYMVVWRGCEEACESFIEDVKDRNLAAKIVVKDIARDKTKLPAIIKEIKNAQADLVVTWGTSVTLGIVGPMAKQVEGVGKANTNEQYLNTIPVVFMIVADPIGANIISSYKATGRANVTGVRNRVPEKINIKAIKAFAPDFQHLGLLYNPQEANSKLKAQELVELAAKMKFQISVTPLTLTAEGELDTASLSSQLAIMKSKKVDFIYLGSSSLIRKSGEVFTRVALDNKLPTLSPYEHLVRKSNALLSVAARYADVGKLAAQQMVDILIEQKTAGSLPVKSVKKYAYVINMQVAKSLNLYPSVNILQYAETIHP